MSIEMTMKRIRTQASWDAMKDRFYTEWEDACNTYQEHQSTRTTHFGFRNCLQVNTYFADHARRMVRERWPDIKKEGDR